MKKKEDDRTYLLDTSAILTLWNVEDGADTVENILKRSPHIAVFVSFMTFMEGKYRIWKENGKPLAFEQVADRLAMLKLPYK